MKILIVEDNFFIVGIILKHLAESIVKRGKELSGYVTVIPNITEAGLLLKDNNYTFDVLLIDHDLPDGNGTWILRNYKERFNHIIAISSIPENNKRLLECGANDQVLKLEHGFGKILAKKIGNITQPAE